MTHKTLKIISIIILIVGSSFINPKPSINFSNEPQSILYGGKLEIGADLNGDNKVERIYIDVISEKTNKHLDSITFNGDYADYLKQFEKVKPRILIKSNHKIPKTIVNCDPRILRPMLLENLGDLNDDGNDEIGYVLECFELEETDSMHILSFRNKKWNNLGSVPISISYSEKFYSVDNDEMIVKMNNKLFYKNKSGEYIEFTLKKLIEC